jgi:uncharacterized protein YecT (DUF1311 family)
MNIHAGAIAMGAALCLGALLQVSPFPARADGATQDALKQIIETANQICQSAPLEQTSQGVTLSGDAKAKVGGLIGKIADLGIDGAAQYQTAKSIGVLQTQLKDVIQNSNNCKLEVFNALEKDLIHRRAPDPIAPTPALSAPEPRSAPPMRETPVVATPSAAPPSWCSRASTQVERLICRTERLSALDAQLTDAYQGALGRMPLNQQQNLRREQNFWIRQRDACQSNSDIVACVERAYSSRLAILGTY